MDGSLRDVHQLSRLLDMHQRSAESFRVGRVLLAGDAAHLTNPTGAMGLTSGVFDVELLVDPLLAMIAGDASAAARRF